MNPLELMKAKGMIQDFGQRHPMIPKFFKRASLEIKEGTIIEMVVTAPDGEPIKTNFRVLSFCRDSLIREQIQRYRCLENVILRKYKWPMEGKELWQRF